MTLHDPLIKYGLIVIILSSHSLHQNAASSSNVLRDERFASLFTDPKFQVDEESAVSHTHSAPPIITRVIV